MALEEPVHDGRWRCCAPTSASGLLESAERNRERRRRADRALRDRPRLPADRRGAARGALARRRDHRGRLLPRPRAPSRRSTARSRCRSSCVERGRRAARRARPTASSPSCPAAGASSSSTSTRSSRTSPSVVPYEDVITYPGREAGPRVRRRRVGRRRRPDRGGPRGGRAGAARAARLRRLPRRAGGRGEEVDRARGRVPVAGADALRRRCGGDRASGSSRRSPSASARSCAPRARKSDLRCGLRTKVSDAPSGSHRSRRRGGRRARPARRTSRATAPAAARGTVGPGFSITLAHAGRVAASRRSIRARTRSSCATSRRAQLPPHRAGRRPDAPRSRRRAPSTWTVTFQEGRYTVVCDPHSHHDAPDVHRREPAAAAAAAAAEARRRRSCWRPSARAARSRSRARAARR